MRYLFLTMALLPSFAKAGYEITFDFKKGFGTAITELNYLGVQYLNNSDHGRSLQSSVSFDGRGECYNPTEAGSWVGAKKQNSSKILQKSKDFSLEYMGWWYNPGELCINEGIRAEYPGDTATSVTSDYLLAKKYKVKENTLTINATFYSPRAHKSATFEALTAYVPSFTFNKIERYDPVTGISHPYGQIGEGKYPVIISSSYLPRAIGIYSYELPEYVGPDPVGYGAFDLSEAGVNKLNCVFRKSDIPANSAHSYSCIIIVGSAKSVRTTINELEKARNR